MKHHFNSSLRTGMHEPGTECGTELQSSKSTWISHNGRVKIHIKSALLKTLCITLYMYLVQSHSKMMDSIGNLVPRISHGCWAYMRELHC